MEETATIFKSVPAEAWVGLVGVCIGALLSVLGVWLSNRSTLRHLKYQLSHEREAKERELARERYEELYVLVEHWLNGLAGVYLNLNLVMQEKIDYNSHLEHVIENAGANEHDFQRLEMIVNIHGLPVKPEYDSVIEARTLLNAISAQHKRQFKAGNTGGSKYYGPFVAAQETIEQRGQVLLKAIASAARRA